MNDANLQSNSPIVAELFSLTERIEQDLPSIPTRISSHNPTITSEQFDSLIASW